MTIPGTERFGLDGVAGAAAAGDNASAATKETLREQRFRVFMRDPLRGHVRFFSRSLPQSL
jgi:hypothetical protein